METKKRAKTNGSEIFKICFCLKSYKTKRARVNFFNSDGCSTEVVEKV